MAIQIQNPKVASSSKIKKIGVKLPFTRSDGGIFEQSVSTQDQLLSNFINLIMTNKGERVMQPEFGTSLRSLVFEQNTPDLYARIKYRLLREIEYWLPYVILDDIIVEQMADTYRIQDQEHGVTITIRATLSEQLANINITFNVTLTGIRITSVE
jgi:phage baseplate assembly protein W